MIVLFSRSIIYNLVNCDATTIVKFVCVIPCESHAMIVLFSRSIIYNLVNCDATTRLLFVFKLI